jgi:lauroyl/myristoyl acyltransferase
MSERETFAEIFSYWYYRGAEWAARTLPERVGRRLFSAAGAVEHARNHGQRRVVSRNLARVLGKPPDSAVVRVAVREAFDSYARYWYDTFLLRALPAQEIRKRFEMRGIEIIDAALERGKGGLFCLPHLGNWDAAGRWMTLHGYSLTAVAETLRPERLFHLFLQHREELGMKILPLGATRKMGEELMGLIAQNEVIALVSDRDLRGRGVEVEMFGATRRLPAGPALLSLTTGSPLIPCAMYDTEDDGWLCLITEPIEVERTDRLRDNVAALTRKLAGRFEEFIAAAPTQWHMWQPAWPEDEIEAPHGSGLEPAPAEGPG